MIRESGNIALRVRPSLQAKILHKLRKRKSNKSSQGRFALPLVPILQTFYVVGRICNVDSVLHYLSQLIGQFSGPYFTERAAEFKSLVELNSHKEIINMVNFCHEREITKINQKGRNLVHQRIEVI